MSLWTAWKEDIQNKFPRGERHAFHVTLSYAVLLVLLESGVSWEWATFGLIGAWIVKEILEQLLTDETLRNSINDVVQGSMILPLYFAHDRDYVVAIWSGSLLLIFYYLLTTRRI
jgi:hypothetical protein